MKKAITILAFIATTFLAMAQPDIRNPRSIGLFRGEVTYSAWAQYFLTNKDASSAVKQLMKDTNAATSFWNAIQTYAFLQNTNALTPSQQSALNLAISNLNSSQSLSWNVNGNQYSQTNFGTIDAQCWSIQNRNSVQVTGAGETNSIGAYSYQFVFPIGYRDYRIFYGPEVDSWRYVVGFIDSHNWLMWKFRTSGAPTNSYIYSMSDGSRGSLPTGLSPSIVLTQPGSYPSITFAPQYRASVLDDGSLAFKSANSQTNFIFDGPVTASQFVGTYAGDGSLLTNVQGVTTFTNDAGIHWSKKIGMSYYSTNASFTLSSSGSADDLSYKTEALIYNTSSTNAITVTLPFSMYSISAAKSVTTAVIPSNSVISLRFMYDGTQYYVADYGGNNATLASMALLPRSLNGYIYMSGGTASLAVPQIGLTNNAPSATLGSVTMSGGKVAIQPSGSGAIDFGSSAGGANSHGTLDVTNSTYTFYGAFGGTASTLRMGSMFTSMATVGQLLISSNAWNTNQFTNIPAGGMGFYPSNQTRVYGVLNSNNVYIIKAVW